MLTVQQALITHCELLADRFAVLDSDPASRFGAPVAPATTALEQQRRGLDSDARLRRAVLPMAARDPDDRGPPILVPPSGHVCGIFARSDASRGVHKAPANEIVATARSASSDGMSDIEQGQLNLLGHQRHPGLPGRRPADAVGRAHDGRPTRNWQYVNIRRLVPLPRGVDPGRHPLGGVRAEQPAALAEAEAHDHRVPDARVARRRAVRRQGRGGVLRAHRRSAQPVLRAAARPPAHRDRRAADLSGRVHHRPHRHLAGRLRGQRKSEEEPPWHGRKDPYGNFNFLVEIDGITRAAFHEASGFDSSIDVIEHREGGENITTRKLPGQVKYSNISLKWGMTDDRELYDWHRQWADGDPAAPAQERLDRAARPPGAGEGALELLQRLAGEVDGPDFNAEGNDVAIETLELAHEGLARA